MIIQRFLVLTGFTVLSVLSADAKSFKDMFPGQTLESPEAQKFVESLDYQQGIIPLGVGGVQLNVPQGYYFLSADNSKRVIVEAWGNPADGASDVLGMIFQKAKTPLDDGWGAVISFSEDGYVSDEAAASTNYDDLLKDMQSAAEESNEERKKQGFPAVHLVGWAVPPYYDEKNHKLHWAKELKFDDTPEHILNYNVRALGRTGVLNMNFVSGVGQLESIKNAIPVVMTIPEYITGSRYEDYIPGADKVAAYGIGGLIAGKVLSKVGLLAIALAFLKKGWIIVVLAFGGLWRFLTGLFRRTPSE